ncbi:TetR/AcrR family transcriptional regulator [Novosphingobium sp. MBES04]|uniref:TetR/AcrR family transcriptional regulator n=1 Tax=Novosphingobium sp. MBES04 TaxID=1206458 RepID=UPI000572F6CF|nr:TetR family transcriptional regulator [Novosphingobium sp. MBES04]GAM07500.1 TetR family transcriptional regulator [Novosphingobium sp. MBES04]
MTIELETTPRRRRHPDAVRTEAIAAARQLLVTGGPDAVTLQSVAGALNMAHGNITHHFGSAANLQTALADALIADMIAAVREGTNKLRIGAITEADLVDLIFDRFESDGVGRLIGWLAAQGSDRLDTMYQHLAKVPAELGQTPEGGLTPEALPKVVAIIVMAALSASLIGPGTLAALDLPETFSRERATDYLMHWRHSGGSAEQPIES